MNNLLDLNTYKIPAQGVNIITLHPRILKNTRAVPFNIFNYDKILHDRATNDIIKNGLTIGCFYIESPGMRSLLKRLNVTTFEMLTAASSIIRPGVAESGMMQEFILRHKDPRRRHYLIPEMKKYLGETYGVMIYQEDVIKITHHIAGLTLEEADIMRRAMSGKMRSHSAMQAITDRFFSSCHAKGIPGPLALLLWKQIESFAGYAFCKAHSASFALLSYQVAFLKAHYPAEFMAGVLSNGGGFYSPAVYIQECKRLGLTVLLPSVNYSNYEYTGKGKTLRVGLMAIKNFNKDSADLIIRERKKRKLYLSLGNFLQRTQCGFEETKLLILCGALDCFALSRIALLRSLDLHYFKHKLTAGDTGDLFADEKIEFRIDTCPDYSIQEKCRIEYETFDYMITKHPLEFYGQYLNDPKIITADRVVQMKGKKVRMLGWYMTAKRVRTKKGETMKFLSLEDLNGTFEAILFPGVYKQVADKTLSMGPYIVEGTVDESLNIIVDRLENVGNIKLKSTFTSDYGQKPYTPSDEGLTLEEMHPPDWIKKDNLICAYAS